MKKVFLLFVFLSQTNSFSQLNYPDSKQYLKELIAIQTLLAENRLDDLKSFFIKYNWQPLSKTHENMFFKSGVPLIENNVYPLIAIESRANKGYSDKFLGILFVKFCEKDFKHNFSLEEGHRVQYLIKNIYELGMSYTTFESISTKENLIVEKIDRYSYKVSPINNKNESYIFNVSNFVPGKIYDLKNSDIYFGPGNIDFTILTYDDLIKDKDGDDFFCVKMNLKSVLSDVKREKINIDDFMKQQNLNDRIWLVDK